MSVTPQQIMSEARQLLREELSELVDLLLAEFFALPEPEIDSAWRVEIRRRIEEIESGKPCVCCAAVRPLARRNFSRKWA
jgi:hypothetical protein